MIRAKRWNKIKKNKKIRSSVPLRSTANERPKPRANALSKCWLCWKYTVALSFGNILFELMVLICLWLFFRDAMWKSPKLHYFSVDIWKEFRYSLKTKNKKDILHLVMRICCRCPGKYLFISMNKFWKKKKREKYIYLKKKTWKKSNNE